jgi:hypothetical protein
MDKLIELRDQGLYTSDHVIVNDRMDSYPSLVQSLIAKFNQLIHLPHCFLQMLEDKRLDLVLLTFPWYISKETSFKMDEYFTRFHTRSLIRCNSCIRGSMLAGLILYLKACQLLIF